MPDQSNGLRFDVYERVHLPDDVAAIEELEEIELVPRIQVVQQGEQAQLKGQLLLSGIYRSQYDLHQPQTLEHWIPVEITLPMNRVQSLDDISVEIDHFDVDLLSSRTLNITGILSLHGIQVEQQEAVDNTWQEEPITVVHRREPSQPSEPQEQRHFSDFPETPRQNEYGQAQNRQEEAGAGRAQAAQQRQADVPPPWGQPFQNQPPRPEQVQPYPFAFESGQAELLQQQAPVWNSAGQPARTDTALPPQESYTPLINWSAFASQQPIEQPSDPSTEPAAVQGRPEEFVEPFVQQEPPTYAAVEERSPFGLFGDISPPARTDTQNVQEDDEDDSFASPADFGSSQPANVQLFESSQPVQSASPSSASPFNQQPVIASSEARQQQDNEAERKELRVAFGRKRPEEAEPEREAVGFRTLLASSRREQETRDAAESASATARENSRVTTGDEIEWKTLFLGKLADEQAFRKVRMCIVQREETLDDIAARYGKNSRELSLYNRLQDQSLSEGQVLYIP